MPTVALDAWCTAWKPRSSLTVSEWGRRHVKLAQSMRSSGYDPDQSYWLRTPLDCIPDTGINEIVIIGPPGSSKTTFFEVGSCYCVAEDPGPMLVVNHNGPMTEDWFESRGKPYLKACKLVAALWPTLATHDKKDVILFDHMPYWIGGANDGTLQSKSCRRVWGDEVWRWKQRMMREARARLHDRWNGQCVFVSQGGDEKAGDANTELFDAYNDSTREVAQWTCPACNHVQPWSWNQMRYDECLDENKICDYEAAGRSARYACANEACKVEFPDDVLVRRQLSSTLTYRQTNPKPKPKSRSFTYPAWCVWWISWSTLVIEWIQANEAKHRGDLGPLKTWKQKRAAQFWSEDLTVPHGALRPSEYTSIDYMEGQLWPGEVLRPMTVDKQKDHYWVRIRAWKQDGTSRGLFYGRINTEIGLRDIQERYKVHDGAVFVDARYEPSDVYSLCAKYNWTATLGEDRKLYTHRPKNRNPYNRYFSEMERVNSGANGYCWKLNFGNEPLKDILSRLRGGHGVEWENENDTSPEFVYQIDSEVKRDVVNKVTKEIVKRWCKIRPNHAWDTEVLQVLAACILNLIGEPPELPPDDEKKDAFDGLQRVDT